MRSGSMLIVALGILTLMSILAVTFASIMNQEKLASKNYVDNIKARFLAEAGVSRFVAEIRRAVEVNPSGTSIASRWFYAPRQVGGNWVSNYDVPLESSNGTMFKLDAAGNMVPMEGVLGATYPGGSDVYRVKLIDTTSQVNINMYDVGEDGPVLQGYFSGLMARILMNLGEAIRATHGLGYNPIDRFDYGSGGAVGIVEFRRTLEGMRFDSKTQLRDYMPPEDFDLLEDYITTTSWVDRQASISNDGVNPFSRPGGVRMSTLGETVMIERSPININTAPVEVLAAVIAGIAGRCFYEIPTQVIRENLNNGAPDTSWTWDRTQEETTYDLDVALLYTQPFPVDKALQIAQQIQAVRNNAPYPFQSFAQWNDFVDRRVTDAMLPDPNGCQVVLIQDGATYTNVAAAARTQPDFGAFYRAACRAVLKANFNPAFISAAFNPDYTAGGLSSGVQATGSMRAPDWLVAARVDKANLLYPRNVAAPNPTMNIATQTTDWCFQTRGVYEITSLGEIRDGDGRVASRDKIRSVVRILDVVIQRTQRDFERHRPDYDPNPYDPQDFSPLGADRGWFQVQDYPENEIYYDPATLAQGAIADPTSGYVSLGCREYAPPAGGLPATETGFAQFGTRFLEALWDRRKDLSATPNARWEWWAETANRQPFGGIPSLNPFASPFGAPVQGASTVVPVEQRSGRGQLFPDGYYATLRHGYFDVRSGGPRDWEPDPNSKIPFLWYPASFPRSRDQTSDQSGWRYQGESDPNFLGYSATGWNGNVLPHQGGIEFWYKPDFDWGRQSGGGVQATPLVCGLFSISNVLENPSAPGNDGSGNTSFGPGNPEGDNDGDFTTGTQIYCFRNSQGDLRVTFLYYEVVGKDDGNTVQTALGTFRREYMSPYTADVTDPATGNTATETFDNIEAYQARYAEPGISRSLQWPPAEIAGDLLDLQPPGAPGPPAVPPGDGIWESWDPARTVEPSPLFSQNADSFGVRFARVDAFVQHQDLIGWRAGEWHHLAVRWDANQTNPAQFLRMWVDGTERTTAVHTIPVAYDGRPSHRMFVRLNEPPYPTRSSGSGDTSVYNPTRPMDQMIVGGICRLQLGRGGMFKWVDGDESWAIIPANGTIDDFRTYDGVGQSVDQPFRYWQDAGGFAAGTFENRFELAGRFPAVNSELELAGIYWQAAVPDTFGGQLLAAPNYPGRIDVQLLTGPDLASMQDPTGDGWVSWPPPSNPLFIHAPCYIAARNGSGGSIKVGQNTEVGYRVNFYPARVGARVVASPILSEVGLIYFLPKEEVIFTERIYE